MARPRSDIRTRIVHAARARFLAEGVDGASLRTIARDAETNVGMIVYYFPTKDELFLAVVEEVYARLLGELGELLAGEEPLRDRLERVFARFGEASDDELEVVRLVVREALLSSERFERVFARMQRGHIKMLLEAFAEGMQRGEIDPGIPLPMLLLSAVGLGGLPQVVRHVTGRRGPFQLLPSARALAKVSAELLFRAIGARGAGEGSVDRVPHRAAGGVRPAPKRVDEAARDDAAPGAKRRKAK